MGQFAIDLRSTLEDGVKVCGEILRGDHITCLKLYDTRFGTSTSWKRGRTGQKIEYLVGYFSAWCIFAILPPTVMLFCLIFISHVVLMLQCNDNRDAWCWIQSKKTDQRFRTAIDQKVGIKSTCLGTISGICPYSENSSGTEVKMLYSLVDILTHPRVVDGLMQSFLKPFYVILVTVISSYIIGK